MSLQQIKIKNEKGDLPGASSKKRVFWLRDIPTVISILALAFSFGTTFVSYIRTEKQDIQSDRTELRNLLQRLAALPRENVEAKLKYENDPGSAAQVASLLNQENAMLAKQAKEIATRIPARYLSAMEYYSIGVALQNSYNVNGAMAMYTKAINVSTEFNDRVGAIRSRAMLYFISGQPESGREDFRRALNIFEEFKKDNYNDYIKNSTDIWTEVSWANSEAGINRMELALRHITEGENYLGAIPESPGAQQLRALINQSKSMIGKAAK